MVDLNPLDWLNSVVSAFENFVSNIGSYLYNAFSTISSAFSTIGSYLSNALNSLKNALSSALSTLKSAFDNVASKLSSLVSSITSTLSTIVNNVANSFSNAFNWVMGKIADAFNYVSTQFAKAIDYVKKGLEYVATEFSKALGYVKDALIGFASKIKEAVDTITKYFFALLDWIKGGFASLWDALNSIINTIVSKFKDAFDYLSNTVKSLFDGSNKNSMINKIVSFFSDFFSTIYTNIVNLWDYVIKFIGSIYNTITNMLFGENGIFSKITSFVGNAINIIDGIKDTLMNEFDKIKTFIVDNLVFVYDFVRLIYAKMIATSTYIFGRLEEITRWVSQKAYDLADTLLKTIMAFWNWIKVKFYNIISGISNAIANVMNIIILKARDKIKELVAVNTSLMLVRKGIETIGKGDYKIGIATTILSPFIGYLLGNMIDTMLPKPLKIQSQNILVGASPYTSPNDIMPDLYEYENVHLEKPNQFNPSDILTITDIPAVLIKRGIYVSERDYIYISDLHGINVSIYPPNKIPVYDNISINDGGGASVQVIPPNLFSEKDTIHLVDVETTTIHKPIFVSNLDTINVAENYAYTTIIPPIHVYGSDGIELADGSALEIDIPLHYKDSIKIEDKPTTQIELQLTSLDSIKIEDNKTIELQTFRGITYENDLGSYDVLAINDIAKVSITY